ncbi:MAG: hypothetical protein JJU37_05880, partial [Balneolaceae bacterium]|nr:hypothetical protein [Balneolaceae bacterium]
MTIKEFREKVAESSHHEWLQDLSLKLNYKNFPEPKVLKGITDIYRFFLNQKKEWERTPEKLHGS